MRQESGTRKRAWFDRPYPGVPPDGVTCIPRYRTEQRAGVPILVYGALRDPETVLERVGLDGPPLIFEPVTATGVAIVWSARGAGRRHTRPVATAVVAPGRVSRLHLLWVGPKDLDAIDAFEGVPYAYVRSLAWFAVRSVMAGGRPIRPWIYVDRAGAMMDENGRYLAVAGIEAEGGDIPTVSHHAIARRLRDAAKR